MGSMKPVNNPEHSEKPCGGNAAPHFEIDLNNVRCFRFINGRKSLLCLLPPRGEVAPMLIESPPGADEAILNRHSPYEEDEG
jgi:hypothetical protein